VSTVQVNKSEPHPLFVNETFAAEFKTAKPILAPIEGDTLQAGVDKHEDVLLDPRSDLSAVRVLS
jgi:hypothetical protein